MTSAIASSFLRASRVVVAAVALVVPAVAWGAALDADSCAKLKSEQEAMEKAGLKETVIRGPEWAKANLAPEKLNEIKRWIEVDEADRSGLRRATPCRSRASRQLPLRRVRALRPFHDPPCW